MRDYDENQKKDSAEEVVFNRRKSKRLAEPKKETLLMEKLKQIKNRFKRLSRDVKSVFYAADRINKTLLNKGRKSLYKKDRIFY